MKKLRKLLFLLLAGLAVFGMTSCGGESETVSVSESVSEPAVTVTEYVSITAEEAKARMDSETDYVIIDARTEEEFAEGHIEGAILIPEYEIADRAADELPDKDQLILVYCRSGRRSKIASQVLAELGYTNVKEFGGIIDWPYDIVK